MDKEQLINNLSNIENYFKTKDKYKSNYTQFAEDYFGVKLLPYQKILLKTIDAKNNILEMISRKIQKELNFTTKVRLTYAISSAILGEKVLFMSLEKHSDKYISYIESFIKLNKEKLEENDITYKIDGNIIKFNTGGRIEFNK